MMHAPIEIGKPSKVEDFVGPRGIVFHPVIGKKAMGRPTVVTQEVLRKLEWAFMHAYSDKEACFYADIATSTLYRYCEENPDFSERKEELKLTPNLAAKLVLVTSIKPEGGTGNLDQARWWANHKIEEFTPKSKLEHGGKVQTEDVSISAPIKAVVAEFHEKLRATIVASRKKPKV